MSFRVLPLPTPLAEAARRTRRAPGYGHAVEAGVAPVDGYGPCRHCLRRTREGEGRLLFSYNPTPGPGEVSVVGPVFIHEAPCAAYAGRGFPEELRGLPLVFEGHREGGLTYLRGEAGTEEEVIAALFADPGVRFLIVRNAEAGCFMARIEREGA